MPDFSITKKATGSHSRILFNVKVAEHLREYPGRDTLWVQFIVNGDTTVHWLNTTDDPSWKLHTLVFEFCTSWLAEHKPRFHSGFLSARSK